MTSTCSGRSAVSGSTRSCCRCARPVGCAASAAAGLVVVDAGEQHGARARGEQLADDRRALLGRLARSVDRLGQPWRSARWWSTRAKPRSANGSRRSMATASSGSTMPERTSSSRSRRAASSTSLSWPVVATSGSSVESARQRIGFLGPLGTFTEQALLTQPDLARASSCRSRRSPTCSWPPRQARSTSASCRSRTRSRARSTPRSTAGVRPRPA